MKNTRKVKGFFYTAVHILEYLIAVLTMIVMVGLLAYEVYKIVDTGAYQLSAEGFLQNILTIVVGLEFVRMLIYLTTANTLEVLIVAIARQVIVNHESALSNIACVLCIGGLFAIRRFLISKNDFKKELSEGGCEENPSE